MSNPLLNGKTIIITGGAGLLGRSFAESVICGGATAVIGDVNFNAAKQSAEEINDKTGRANAYPLALDITSKHSLKEAINHLANTFGRIDALVNNAYPRNQHYGRHFFDVEYPDFCENLSINLGGYFLASQQFASYFRAQGHGNIINISSIYGVIAPRFEIYESTGMTTPVEYAAIKSGLIHLTKYMAKYLKGSKIRVNSISPGGIYDKQQHSFVENYKKYCCNKGMLDAEDIVGTLIYLLSDLSIHVTGQNVIVDDGFTL